LSIPLPSSRLAFWIALAVVAVSARANIMFILFSWSVVAAIGGQKVADHSGGLEHLMAFVVHVALYLAILYVVRRAVRPESRRMVSLVTLITGLSYSSLVIGVTVYLVTHGDLP
jgi:hypothetical protein